MKVSASREHLLEALQSVIGVVERRQTMPILSNILLSARDNRLRATGTDLEVELVAALMAQALRRRDDEAAIGNVRDEVAALCRDFNPYASFTK